MLKLHCLPQCVEGEQIKFWEAVQQTASRNKTDAQPYVERIVAHANRHMLSRKVVDRENTTEALVASMNGTGLTLFLGGKNLGKSLLKQAALEKCDSSSMYVITEDMRGKAGASILRVLVNKMLQKSGKDNKLFKLFGPLLEFLAVGEAIAMGSPGAATAIANIVSKAFSSVTDMGELIAALDKCLQNVIDNGRNLVFVVDEANLALPGLTSGQDAEEKKEAKAALAAITKWTKQDSLASVVLISSEFGYPFLLQAAGLDLRDIGKVIIIEEVPKDDMLKMLKDDWGMDSDLAKMFYNHFGGDIYTTKQALESLIRKGADFDPFAVVRCPGLPSCVEDAAARAHLENIAKQGFSLVKNVETDEGARMIADRNVGGVIDKDAITWGLPEIFKNTTCEWAVIPSSYHMKLLIARKLQQIPLPSGGAGTAPPAVWVRQIRKDDGGFDFVGNAFQVKDKDMQNIDDLKEAIKTKNPATVQCDAFQIDIYSRQDGVWRKEAEDSSIEHGASKTDCYGYFIP